MSCSILGKQISLTNFVGGQMLGVFEGALPSTQGQPEIDAGAFVQFDCGVFVMTNFLRSFVRDESGAAAAEYALILAIVGAGIAAAALALGGAITGAMSSAAAEITENAAG
jgi:pilus assembly protein Flp/PilA